jgi:hypothetical protein
MKMSKQYSLQQDLERLQLRDATKKGSLFSTSDPDVHQGHINSIEYATYFNTGIGL